MEFALARADTTDFSTVDEYLLIIRRSKEESLVNAILKQGIATAE